ncbi:DNA repair protein RecN [Hoyosella altamirensis]|uniref:DNA repair protein RecN n=1 Tax=Hoyosella altamirensis TaxID=616997 RepID=A0A839RRE4_9ACTN|nr:DNA repair protein RecN [Hoyosella altamirensis]MBB3038666.1 DNA repair protein RecN (Recombination protein N) [Hoyosella altamirensis]
MLAELRINGLGVIDAASAELDPGFTVLTGETGAGKTMVVTSLHLLSGARADAKRVRAGAERATVEGRFTIDGVAKSVKEEIAEILESSGAEEDSDGSVIAVRTVSRDGRSRAHLGGRSVPAGVLGRFTGALLTVHGQNDQLRLLKADQQRGALDRFAGEAITPLLDRYRSARAEWKKLTKELHERTTRSRELAQEADRLQFGLNEIDAVDPQPGEDESIAAEVRRLSDLDSLRGAATEALAAIAGASDIADTAETGAENALELLGKARHSLEGADDPSLGELAPRFRDAIALVGDLGAELSSYLEGLPSDPGALDGLLNRQSDLKMLTRKYAADVDGVLEWASSARERLASIDVSAEALSELSAAVAAAGRELAGHAVKLSAARRRAAVALSKAVSGELAGLAMGRAKLEVSVETTPVEAKTDGAIEVEKSWYVPGPYGIDEVEFRLAAHPGAEPMPLAKSASGGELSRVMLALEVVLAGGDSAASMVFDEVDAGVGGRAAIEIGRRLARLARTHQVIVVTHLPQVAAFADTHLVVDKTDQPGGTIVSGVRNLGPEDRVAELARMLAGMGDSDTGRAHAEELLAVAEQERQALAA